MGRRAHGREHRHHRRQEINRCLKYLIFSVNFVFLICSIVCTVLGVYLYANDFRAVLEAVDFFLNPSILLIVCGCIMFLIAFLGCMGALRENTCMLKAFSMCLFFAYVSLVILAFVVFILFYSDTKTGVSIQTLLQTGVSKYHDNENMRELMDYLQSNLGCCGASSQGYKDWNNNQLYNCSAANAAPEQCGVPPSCCKSNTNGSAFLVSPPVAPTAAIPALAASAQPFEARTGIGDSAANPRCGFHAQDKSITELQNILYTDGCLQPLQRAFEAHAIIIGAVIGAVIVPVCMSVTLSNVLAKQIERQHYLLDREARKEERRRRRNKSKHREVLANTTLPLGADAQLRVARHVIENTVYRQPSPLTKEPPAKLVIENDYTMHNPLFPYHDYDYAKTGPPPEFFYQQDPFYVGLHSPAPVPIYERLPRRKRRTRKTSKSGERRSSATPHRRPRHPRSHPDHYRLNRTRSEDANLEATYSGPIIVELSSITHDLPPPQYQPHEVSSAESLGGHESVYTMNNA